MEKLAIPANQDPARISLYEGDSQVPAPLRTPLSEGECARFFDRDEGPVTFTVRVPLDELAGRSIDGLVEYIERHAFGFPVALGSPEFRAVGASFDQFDKRFCGFVHLQVTGSVSLAK
jgi:hypothetical protein